MSSKLIQIREFIRTFLLSSNIHGFNHLSKPKRHPLERLIWLSLIIVSIYAAINLSALFLTRYMENPTVISMERDKFSWNTSFPTATICPDAKLDEELLEMYVQSSSATNKTALKEFLETLSQGTYETFDSITNYPDINPETYMDLLLKLQFTFKPVISNSGVNGRQYQMEQVITERGICYSFNSQLARYSSPKYWSENQWSVFPENDTFYVNPLDGEVFANVVNMSTGYKLILHGPFDVADVASKAVVSPNGFFLQVYLTALSIYSSERTRGLKVNQRKCRFYDESNLRRSPVYSYVLCRMECRANLAQKLCGCVPHFYRKLDGDKVCGVEGLHCLAKYKERLIPLKKECNCFTNCDEVNFIIQYVDSREWFLGSNLQWGLKEYPRMRLKRDVIFGFADVLVYIGGMAGLFFGCSVLSFIEIFYFFTLRLYWFFIRKHNDRKISKMIKMPPK